MPWKETLPVDQRIRFIADYERRLFSVSELSGRFGVGRKTAYKWASSVPRGRSCGSERPYEATPFLPVPDPKKCYPCPLTKVLPMSLTVQPQSSGHPRHVQYHSPFTRTQ